MAEKLVNSLTDGDPIKEKETRLAAEKVLNQEYDFGTRYYWQCLER